MVKRWVECGLPTKVCTCGHEGYDHRTGTCESCECKAFVARACRNKKDNCKNHNRDKYQQYESERCHAIFEAEHEGIEDYPFDPSQCGIYFIQCREFVKIGQTTQIRRRMTALAIGVPFELSLVGFIRCPLSELTTRETDFHIRFAAQHHRGEWFRLESPLIEFIESLRQAKEKP